MTFSQTATAHVWTATNFLNVRDRPCMHDAGSPPTTRMGKTPIMYRYAHVLDDANASVQPGLQSSLCVLVPNFPRGPPPPPKPRPFSVHAAKTLPGLSNAL